MRNSHIMIFMHVQIFKEKKLSTAEKVRPANMDLFIYDLLHKVTTE